ncbi:MFS transporter [Streptomyces sp. NPDC002088]|uniref:MFS transporter n=1 Tax=Streptomyces sp. NPDC002088 TaxID=3154665 RepID=UPI00331CA3C9
MTAMPLGDRAGPGVERPLAFWLGVIACTAGVVLHLPMYLHARDMGYRMAGMQADTPMLVGMVLVVVGLASVLYGLLPAKGAEVRQAASRVRVRALDDAPLRKQHAALLLAMTVAITIDVMKPTTLSFVTPGMAAEYGLLPANPHGHVTVAWVPLAGITGTVVGSLIWGVLSDCIGRRASLLFAGMLFVTTSICGTMPGFTWNLVMCALMGIGAGGMLPVAFTLLAETMPARHRGWAMVLIGGNGVGAYLLVSWLSGALTPHYSWRILWLIGLPTGLLFMVVGRWIPESPRYLIARGRTAEARAVMAHYGAAAHDISHGRIGEPGEGVGVAPRVRTPLLETSLAIACLGLGIGLVTYGFQQWVPTNLQRLGYTSVKSDYTIRNASLIGLPLTALSAWMYAALGSRRTLLSVSLVTSTALAVFAIWGDQLAHTRTLLSLLLVVPIAGTSSLAAVAVGYAAEVYPTRMRARGTGLAAALTKAGGVLILAVVVGIKTVPSIGATAIFGAIPLLLSALALLRVGPETKARRLESITEDATPTPERV